MDAKQTGSKHSPRASANSTVHDPITQISWYRADSENKRLMLYEQAV